MKNLFTSLAGILISFGVMYSQIPSGEIEQLDRELLQQEMEILGITYPPGNRSMAGNRSMPGNRSIPGNMSLPGNRPMTGNMSMAGSRGNNLKSGQADIGNPPDWNWVRSFTGSGGVEFTDIEVDGSGYVYAYGTFSDSIKIKETTLVSKGLRDVFIMKVSSSGIISWIRQLEASQDENIYSNILMVSDAGVVLTGTLESRSVSGGGKLATGTGDETIFMAGISSGGDVNWIKLYSEDPTKTIMADAENNILRLTETHLYKYDPDGNAIWDVTSDGGFYDFDIYENSIWVTGAVVDSGLSVGDSVFHFEWSYGAFFIARLDSAGNFGFVEFMATSVQQLRYVYLHIEIDGLGDIYLAGYPRGEVYFRDSTIQAGWIDGFMMKIDTNMSVKWLINKELYPYMRFYELHMVNNNQFFVYGRYYDSIALGNITMIPETQYGYFIADFDSTGDVRNIYIYEDYQVPFEIISGGAIYRGLKEGYDLNLTKKTLSGAEYWDIGIGNTGGSASIAYTMDIDEDGNMYAQGFYNGTVRILGGVTKGRGIIFLKFSNDGSIEWYKTMEGPSGFPSGIKADDEGNVYAWGGFYEYIKMEGLEFYQNEKDADDLYLVKLDRDGDLKFIKQFDGTGYFVTTGGIDLTPENDIILSGQFSDTLRLGAYTLTADNNDGLDMVIAKINPSGNILWARSYGGNYTDYARSVASDSMGNIYFTGSFRDSIAFDTIVFSGHNGSYDFILVKLDPNGNVVWARRGGPDNYSTMGYSITVHGDQVYVEGRARTRLDFMPTITFGDKVFISEFESNLFLVNYTVSGDLNWVKLFKANNYNLALYKIDTDPAGNIYAGGMFRDTLIVESNQVTGSEARYYNYYILKFNPEGEFQWMKSSESGNTGDVLLFSLAAFEEDIVLVAGRISNGFITVGGETIKTASTASFAGLLGEDIIGCIMDLTVETVDEDFGMENGTAELSISGGTEPYEIAWSTGEVGTASFIDSLPAGQYQVTVVDDKDCEQFGLFSINIKNGPVISLKEIGNVSCHGEGDGFIDIDVTGGTEPYTISWDNGYDSEYLADLQAAPYTVTVIDAGGLMVSKEFTIEEPKPLDVSYTISDASCGGMSDGTIDVFTSGGTKSYDWEWNTGVFTQSLSNEKAGKYTITVLDANNCELKAEIALSEKNAPIVETEYLEPADCEIANGGAKVRVVNSTGIINFLWSDASGTTIPELTGQRARGYFVTVTNQAGCKTIHLVDIPEKKPVENQICVVTVDTVIGSNLVVWEKVEDAIIYHVYRETSAKDVYLLAGSVPGGDRSVFVDTVANPTIRSYRYKIAAVDECGTESYLSHLHKTVHLQIYPGLTESIMNLAWDDYIGETFDQFEVYRYTSLFGWELLDEMPSTLKSFTDFNVPPGKVFYNVRVPLPNPCTPTGLDKSGSGYKEGTAPYKHSLSNMDDNKLKETGVKSHMSDKFYVYPNPTPGHIILWSEEFNIIDGEILVTDLSGRRVMHKKFENNLSGRLELDLTGQSSGSYLVQLRTNGQVYFQKLVKQ